MVDQLIPDIVEGATQAMGAPDGWDEEKFGECDVLCVREQDGRFISKWQLSFKQRLKLLLGWSLYLQIVGSQPPVAITLQKIK